MYKVPMDKPNGVGLRVGGRGQRERAVGKNGDNGT